jgi:hypothetical protein
VDGGVQSQEDVLAFGHSGVATGYW